MRYLSVWTQWESDSIDGVIPISVYFNLYITIWIDKELSWFYEYIIHVILIFAMDGFSEQMTATFVLNGGVFTSSFSGWWPCWQPIWTRAQKSWFFLLLDMILTWKLSAIYFVALNHGDSGSRIYQFVPWYTYRVPFGGELMGHWWVWSARYFCLTWYCL